MKSKLILCLALVLSGEMNESFEFQVRINVR
ncbi:MAG: hypothetical protein QOD03_281 [Verrucomicrobiota bacterium]|jgi:hypothetical protein